MELDFLPETLAVVWRSTMILFGAALAGKILFGLIYKNTFISNLPPERRLAWFGVLVFIVQNLIIQIVRFNDTVLLYGVPISTVAFFIFWLALRNIKDSYPCEEEDVGDGTTARRPQSSP